MRPHGKGDRFRSSGSNCDETLKKDVDPQQLFVDLSLLICEGRQPELSARGRVQGPHCPSAFVPTFGGDNGDNGQQSTTNAAVAKSSLDGQARHVCDWTNDKCVKARQIESDIRHLWSRGIPACLTVSLLPDECTKQENCIADALVLEKWTIQQATKRTREDKLLPGQFLMQAVRSHLHFSQLSAWLMASRGKWPINLIYRVCLPGELDTSLPLVPHSSSSAPDLASASSGLVFEKHQFPLCAAGKNVSLSVVVESLPRSESAPARFCYCVRPSTSGLGAAVGSSNRDIGDPTSTSDLPLPLSSDQSESFRPPDESSGPSWRGKNEEATETDALESPLDASRRDSYHSFFDEHSASRANETTTDPGPSQLAYTPVSLRSVVSINLRPIGGKESISATNPLFEANLSSSIRFNSRHHLKTRVDALRNEADLRSSKLRMLSSTSPGREVGDDPSQPLATNSRIRGKPRFFVSNDDENDNESNDEEENQAFSPNLGSSNSEQRRQRPSDSKVARKLAFSENDPATIDGSFSDWIHQAVEGRDGVLEMARIDVPSFDPDAAVEQTHRRCISERQGKDESVQPLVLKTCPPGYGRKLKRAPTTSAAASAGPVQFHPKTGLPLSSSPTPMKRNHSSFNYDPCITSVSALKSALYCYDYESGGSSDSDSGFPLCKSAPASTNLLGSFEESALNGRIKPFGSIDGFYLELGASGAFCPSHVTLPVTTLFFNVSDDNAPSPYFGLCSLESISRRGYHVPKKGSVQATLFNPQGTVVKMFVVRYDLADMPPSCQTFVRQRTFFMPSSASLRDAMSNRSWLRYLIHLRFASSSSGKLFLHTDIRMLFSRKSELEAYNFNCVDGNAASPNKDVETYELRSFTEMPKDPKFSPRKFNRSDKR